MKFRELAQMTVLKVDWWLHLVGGALIVFFAPWPPGFVVPLLYLVGDMRETLQQIASFEMKVKSYAQTVPYQDALPGHAETVTEGTTEGAPLGSKRRHEALAWLWGGLLAAPLWYLL